MIEGKIEHIGFTMKISKLQRFVIFDEFWRVMWYWTLVQFLRY